MSCENLHYMKESLIQILSQFEDKIKSSTLSKNSIDIQLGLIQDLQDVILKLNGSKSILPDFFIQLKISPRHGWNGRGQRKRILLP